MEQIITYRHSVRGALDEFTEKTKFKNLLRSDALIEIAASVARHQEEGVQLFPEVYICNDIQQFRQQTAGSELFLIGESASVLEGVKKAMKKCSPLTSRDWDILIEVTTAGCRYGVFKLSSVPSALTLESTYFSGESENLPPAIQVSARKPSVVTFKSDCGKTLTVCFTHNEVISEDLVSSETLLVDSILSSVTHNNTYHATKAFLLKLFRHVLKGIHGTLICTIDQKWITSAKLPVMLSDSVRLTPEIDFIRAISNMREANPVIEDICSPQSYYDLVKGIISFDGITVFTNNGCLLAYNVFVESSLPKGKKRDEIQGSRKRAFSVLESSLGKPILSAFYQSQDGKTLFKKL